MWAWHITTAQAGMSIKEFLQNEADFSKRLLIQAKSEGGFIAVNGDRKTVRYVLQAKDILTVKFPKERPSARMHKFDMPLKIIYEDEHLLIIDKPGTMAVIPSRQHPNGTLANGVLAYYEKQGIDAAIHVVTRLDRETSGLVIFAKNQYTHSLLSNQQRNHLIERKYKAIVQGDLSNHRTIIDAAIGRKDGSIIERTVRPDGKPAVTHYEVLKENKDISLVEIKLETGRTHQIRVHFNYLGHPLLGDTLYGRASKLINRQALHCYFLAFRHPFTGEKLSFHCELSEDMLEIVDKMI